MHSVSDSEQQRRNAHQGLQLSDFAQNTKLKYQSKSTLVSKSIFLFKRLTLQVRVAAIKVLHRLILVCSEDYLPFIPEAIPFIAELSEDESELVEEHVKLLIIDVEQLIGEPINKYL